MEMDGFLDFAVRSCYLALFAICLIIAAKGFRGWNQPVDPHSGLPVQGSAKDSDFVSSIQEGYEKFRESPFLVPFPAIPFIVLPRKYADEIKTIPSAAMNFVGDLKKRFHPKYTFIGAVDYAMFMQIINLSLTRDIPRVLRLLQDEMEYVDRSIIEDCTEWKSFTVKDFALDTIALLSARVFIDDTKISRTKRWLECTTRYPRDSMAAEPKLKRYPKWTLPVMHYFIPEVRRVLGYKRHFENVIKPVLQGRLRDMQQSDFKRPNDITQDIIDNPNGKGLDLEMHAILQLDLTQASIVNSSNTLHQILIDVAYRPELVAELRRELEEVMEAEGGVLTKNNINSLWKLDSFMKECQRYSPAGIVSHIRMVLQPLKLSNNVQLYPDDMIACANYAVNRDSSVYESPDVFDPQRFLKLRNQPGNENKFQYTSNSIDMLDFGYGRHPCPGRFFAANKMKVVLAHLLLNYEIKLDGSEERPPNIFTGILVLPNPEAKILLKRRV